MTARDILKNFNLYIDGVGYAGQVEEVTPPKLTKKTEEFRGGGMNAPVKIGMGQEAMESDFTMIQLSRELLSYYGIADGQFLPVTLRGTLESYDGTKTQIVHSMRGTITEIDQGTWKAGDKATLKVSMNLNYYKLQHGDKVVQEIDVINMVHIVNGVDQLAVQRAHLGL